MPSRYEGLPNAVLEAMGCGIPVVAPAVPGMAEATRVHAILVPPDDPQALAAAVVNALEKPITPPPNWSMPSFEEVASLHQRVFERAHARRNEQRHSLDFLRN
jgi:glycosyltransferase involved in cell wall biosynthesis